MSVFEKKALANKITRLLEINGGVTDSYIEELMEQYRNACKKD